MGRPRLPPGTYGEITVAPQPPTGDGRPRYKARARFRGTDGTTRMVARYGQTKTEAKHRLREALTHVQKTYKATAIDVDSTVAELAASWLVASSADWSTNTRARYELAVRKQVIPYLGGLRVAELSRARVNGALTRALAESGPGAAKSAKAALTGMCRLALAHDALEVNPVRDTVSIAGGRKPKPKALTVEETEDLCDRLRSDERAVFLDLPDLVEWMLGTGARIGEACAARTATVDLDLQQWTIDATVVRVPGVGLEVQERPKSKAGLRVIPLPQQCVDIARRRQSELRLADDLGVLFGSPRAKSLRDPSNTAGDLRETLDRLGFKSVSSHTFRKTVATRLDEAGWSGGQIADHLGHANPSMTQDVYVGRRVVSADAARILER